MAHPILDPDAIRADLAPRIDRLAGAYRELFGIELTLLGGICRQWAEALCGPDKAAGQVARELLEHLVPEAEQRGSAFWGTALGRAIAWWTGGPLDSGDQAAMPGGSTVSRAAVAEIFGFTRQRLFELQKAGRLCTQDQVKDEMRARWPR